MKKPKGVSLEEDLFERVKVAAKTKRESASKWIEDAIYERFERVVAETPHIPAPNGEKHKSRKRVSYSKSKKQTKK